MLWMSCQSSSADDLVVEPVGLVELVEAVDDGVADVVVAVEVVPVFDAAPVEQALEAVLGVAAGDDIEPTKLFRIASISLPAC